MHSNVNRTLIRGPLKSVQCATYLRFEFASGGQEHCSYD
jgi:hypothetical protein